MPTAYSVLFVVILDVTVAVVRVDEQRKKRSLISGASSKSPPVCTVQFVLFVGVAVVDVELDVVAGAVRFVVRDGLQVVACARRAAGASCRHCRD